MMGKRGRTLTRTRSAGRLWGNMPTKRSLSPKHRLVLWGTVLGVYLVLVVRLFLFAESDACLDAGGVYRYSDRSCTLPEGLGIDYLPVLERSGLVAFWTVLFLGPALGVVPLYVMLKKLLDGWTR